MTRLAVVRNAWIECKGLWRVAGWPATLAVLVAVFVVQAQEPHFVRRMRIEFFWPSVGAIVALILCLLPLVWALGRRADAAWSDRFGRWPWRGVLSGWLALVGCGVALTGVAAAAIYTAQRINGADSIAVPLLDFSVRELCVLLPVAALAPALGAAGWRPGPMVLAWGLVLAACSGVFGLGLPIPFDKFLGDRIGAAGVTALCVDVAGTTIGGLLVSTAVVARRP